MKGRLLVVDDEHGILVALKGLFGKEGYEVETAESGEEALAKVKAGLFHVIITDLSMQGMSGLDLMRAVRQLDPGCAVLMITAYGTQRIAVEAMKAGAEDYLPKPFDNDELRIKVRNVMEKQLLRRAYNRLVEQVNLESGRFAGMIGRSRAMMRVFETIDKVAPTDVTVLVRGESGTGKELVARAIHSHSPRANGPFMPVNCAAFSRELVESELFGHEKGAFTGAVARREGKFEAADGGTLFLDEIGDMSLETQAKLLRVIQEKRFERIGGNQSLVADVRIIAATNQNLEAMAADGRFREDLYYRIKVVEVRVPPLRERREDIAPLAMHFLDEACKQFGALAQGRDRTGGDSVLGRRDHTGGTARRLCERERRCRQQPRRGADGGRGRDGRNAGRRRRGQVPRGQGKIRRAVGARFFYQRAQGHGRQYLARRRAGRDVPAEFSAKDARAWHQRRRPRTENARRVTTRDEYQ